MGVRCGRRNSPIGHCQIHELPACRTCLDQVLLCQAHGHPDDDHDLDHALGRAPCHAHDLAPDHVLDRVDCHDHDLADEFQFLAQYQCWQVPCYDPLVWFVRIGVLPPPYTD